LHLELQIGRAAQAVPFLLARGDARIAELGPARRLLARG
jgi:hypothetical protein